SVRHRRLRGRGNARIMHMQAPDGLHPPRLLTRTEYERIVETGIFGRERLELIRGVVIRMPPIHPPHADSVDRFNESLVHALYGPARVRIQLPFVAADESMPQPDIALVPVGDYSARHPDRAYVLIEVADSSLRYDRRVSRRRPRRARRTPRPVKTTAI